MRGTGMHKVAWGRPATVLVVGGAAATMSLLLLVRPGALDLAGTAAATSLLLHVVVLVAAAFTYLNWRLSGGVLAGWLTLTLTMLSAPHIALAAVLIADPEVADNGPWWPLLTKVAAVAVLLGVVLFAARLEELPVAPVPVDPLAAGLAAGIAFSGLGLALLRWAPEVMLPSALLTFASLVPALLAVAVALASMKGAQVTSGLRWRLCGGVALVTFGGTIAHSMLPAVTRDALTVGSTGLGTLVLCQLSLEMVRASLRNKKRELRYLYQRLIEVETEDRENRARLHQVAATVAGLTSVSRLLHEPDIALPRQRRWLLEHTLDAELSRLGRLMAERDDRLTVFALDDVLRPLVVAQQAQGRSVHWAPSGAVVYANPDSLAEAVHVLLENAAKHGKGTGATVSVFGSTLAEGGTVEIRVSDSGPGVGADVRGRLFEWGARGADSRGQGIGLSLARDLVEQQGGYLVLDDSPHAGATFVLGLKAGARDDAAGNRAV